MGTKITNRERPAPAHGRVRSPAQLGALFRAERKRRGLTLAEVYDATGLSTRFLSEFERGKENASLGRVLRALESLGLEVLVFPRPESQRLLRMTRSDQNEKADTTAEAREP
ncbi:MAG: transcriptional regulator [Deltaproteobacteria bacterium]|nr:MAG: transcriptional regulator [Deltaproteobacteria bacterium]